MDTAWLARRVADCSFVSAQRRPFGRRFAFLALETVR